MVFFFQTSEGYVIYMGKDKFENEDLIKYGLPEDLWFHVDDMSSAHVYLRLHKNERLEDVSPAVIDQCSQLVKANSIAGCKLHEVYVVYTRWRNLLKTSDMEVGAISYHDRSKVKRVKVEKNTELIKTLNKTKIESYPDLAALQLVRAREFQQEQKEQKRSQMQQEKESRRLQQEQARQRSYADVMISENMQSNKEMSSSVDTSAAKEYEDDFM